MLKELGFKESLQIMLIMSKALEKLGNLSRMKKIALIINS